MRIDVDLDLCELHGQCVAVAPDLFRFDDDGELEFTVDVPAGQEASAEEAAALCPTGAIALAP